MSKNHTAQFKIGDRIKFKKGGPKHTNVNPGEITSILMRAKPADYMRAAVSVRSAKPHGGAIDFGTEGEVIGVCWCPNGFNYLIKLDDKRQNPVMAYHYSQLKLV